jgi:hypothetical protein
VLLELDKHAKTSKCPKNQSARLSHSQKGKSLKILKISALVVLSSVSLLDTLPMGRRADSETLKARKKRELMDSLYSEAAQLYQEEHQPNTTFPEGRNKPLSVRILVSITSRDILIESWPDINVLEE